MPHPFSLGQTVSPSYGWLTSGKKMLLGGSFAGRGVGWGVAVPVGVGGRLVGTSVLGPPGVCVGVAVGVWLGIAVRVAVAVAVVVTVAVAVPVGVPVGVQVGDGVG